MIIRIAIKKGIKRHNFSKWVGRTQGVMIITRPRRCGDEGVSIPCVLCRKALERHNIHWSAMSYTGIVNTRTDKDIPKSIPTGKQKRHYKFVD